MAKQTSTPLYLILVVVCFIMVTTAQGNNIKKKYLLVKQMLSLYDAQSECNKLDARLVQIDNSQENDFVFETIVKKLSSQQYIWLGARREAGSSTFKWLDGSEMKYVNWYYKPETKSECKGIQMFVSYQGKWLDYPCDQKQFALCEQIIAKPQIHPPKTTQPPNYLSDTKLGGLIDTIAAVEQKLNNLIQDNRLAMTTLTAKLTYNVDRCDLKYNDMATELEYIKLLNRGLVTRIDGQDKDIKNELIRMGTNEQTCQSSVDKLKVNQEQLEKDNEMLERRINRIEQKTYSAIENNSNKRDG